MGAPERNFHPICDRRMFTFASGIGSGYDGNLNDFRACVNCFQFGLALKRIFDFFLMIGTDVYEIVFGLLWKLKRFRFKEDVVTIEKSVCLYSEFERRRRFRRREIILKNNQKTEVNKARRLFASSELMGFFSEPNIVYSVDEAALFIWAQFSSNFQLLRRIQRETKVCIYGIFINNSEIHGVVICCEIVQ